MKTHLVNKKQNPLQLVVLVIALVLSSLIGKAQGDGSGSISLDITDDTCNQGIGSAHLTVSSMFQSQMMITWGYDDFITGERREVYDVLSLNNLHQGLVGVIVRSCDKIIFESYKYVGNDSNDFNATITVTTNTQSCEEVSAELVVVPTGGMGPYTFEWGTNFMTVYEPGYYSCKVWDSYNNVCRAATYVTMEKLQCAVDPNEILGPEGYGEDMMIATTQRIPYTITFENDPEFATAPASRVEIEYPIPSGQKISSFRLGDFGFGQFVFTVPSNTSTYYQRLDVSDSLGVWVDVTAGIDVVHSRAFWIFQSIDPSTGSEPQSSQLGFLLVNDDVGRGEGYVSYNILPADNMHTGDTTAAVATIVFDDNAPIGTNVWTNMFDAVAPSSTIESTNVISADSTNCIINFSSQDDLNGSGVHSIELFVSVNGEQYVSAGSYAPDLEVNYPLMSGSYFEFISIATDNVGNIETFKTVPDAVVDFGSAPSDINLSKYYFYENELVGTTVGEFSTIDLGDVFAYQLVDGEGSSDNDLFAISGNKLVTNTDFNCENRLEYSVRVRSTDVSNLFFEKEFSINMIKTNQTYDLNYEGEVCQGESFIGYGWNIDLYDSIPGIYTYVRTLETTRGCDSIRTLTLRVNPIYTTLIEDEILEGEDYHMHGFDVLNPPVGLFHDTLSYNSIYGCDSLVVLELRVNPLAVTQSNSLISGWNWWSTYIDMSTPEDFDKLKNALGSNASIIKSRTGGFVSYYGDWYGTLTMLSNSEMYMINMTSAHQTSITGPLTTLSANPITLNHGWNWIGYPTDMSQAINAALVNLSANGNDMMKSRNSFATYYPSLGWVGTLTNLTPGSGYMYNSSNAETVSFVYASPSKAGYLSEEVYATNHWDVSVGEYEMNATIIGVIDIDGQEQRGENFVLGAFIGNRCVGQTNTLYLEAIDRYYVFLTYFGNDNDEITFRMFDESNNIEYDEAETTVLFEANAMLGTIDNPFVIDFNTTGINENGFAQLTLFPNPVKAGNNVRIRVSENLSAGLEIEIITTMGILYNKITHKGNVVEMKSPDTPGVYMIKMTDKNGNVNFGKLIVK